MAHHTTQRRILAKPEEEPKLKPSMDPTLIKKHPKPTTTTTSHHHIRPNPDPPLHSKPSSFMSHNFSRLNPYHRKAHKPQNPTNPHPTPCVMDTHLQAKALTVSVDSSMFSLTKSNHLTRTTIAPKLEKDSTKARKEVSKEKLKKELDKKKFHEVKVNEKKKETREELDVKRLSEKLKDVEMKDLQDCRGSKRVSVSLAVRGGRRRSFSDSQVDLADILASNGVKVVSADMPPFMQIHVVDCARKAYDSMEKFTSKTLALTLKKEFDGVYGPAWHCIVGTSFGSFVTHSVGGFMYFSMDQKLYILLFKTTVQRAD